MFKEIIKSTKWNGETIELSTGKFARQADGSVMVRMGDSAVLCTSVTEKEIKENVDFFPLTVSYQEKTYSAGKIPGGFLKRETGKSDKETLVSRLIDRPIRPLFHSGFFNETQVICNVHSFDKKGNTDILALIGASAALRISGVPLTEIVAASRVGLINGEFVLNPTCEQIKESKLDLVVAGTKNSVMMVESEADFLTESQMLEAVEFGHRGFQSIINLIEEFEKEAAKPAWETTNLFPDVLKNEIKKLAKDKITSAFALTVKKERYSAIDIITSEIRERFTADEKYTQLQVDSALSAVKSEILRADTLKKQIRIDGRKPDEIRDIECEVSLFKGTHGSSLFTRGETQALVSATLGTIQDEQIIDNIEGEYKENFLLNYIFPSYSVGEVGALRAPGRREIGHGKLAWRALKRALPKKEDFPYTIRVVSEITESNGSSSMATVCGGSMSMMDAGVPIKAPIAGIAMGLIKEKDNFMVLSDIIADEDHLGDMDFKVAGSSDGVTALQMDIKVAGITFDVMKKALDQAKLGRIHILEKMAKAIESVSEIGDGVPLVESFMVNKDKIREIIGSGGKVIREICDTTSAKIDISDEGLVVVSAVGKENLNSAINKIKSIAFDPEIGSVFEGTVVKILESGAFVNYSGSRDGFVHISEISEERIKSVASVLKEGQKVKVKLIGFERGKSKLTIKNAESENTSEKSEKKAKDEDSSAQDTKQAKSDVSVKKRNKKKVGSSIKQDMPEVIERKYFS
jgi:polyribonucleotide nucleotidyltransferase